MEKRRQTGWRLIGVACVLALSIASSSQEQGPLPKHRTMSGVAVGHQYRQDDMPSIARAPDGSLWIAWLSFNGERDDVAIRHFRDNEWQNIQWVPGTSGNSWLPQVLVDGSNRVWVIWSQQLHGNWGIYARRFDPADQEWGPLQTLGSDPLPDINPRAWSDGKGRAAVVWQGFRRQSASARALSNIFLRVLDGEAWSSEIRVTHHEADDWDPAAAMDSKGNVWVAFDTYKNGNYDVFLAHVRDGQVIESEISVAMTPRFEARATVTVDTLDRVWVAWESGLPNWGKDRGKILGKQQVGAPLGGFRQPRVACYDQGRWFEPESSLTSLFGAANTYQPHIVSDGRGSVWVLAMMRKLGPLRLSTQHKRAYWEYWAKAPFGYWEYYVTHLTGRQWAEPFALPNSKGRSSTRAGAAQLADGTLWLAWPTDNRNEVYYHRPIRQQIYAGSISPIPAGPALLKPVSEKPSDLPRGHYSDEANDIRAFLEYAAAIDGTTHRVLRGDLHRHTELSWDEGGANDGSLQDFYRYMLDVASLDFGANTEHQGGAWPYWWWYSQKMADMYCLPGSYASLFSYERSASFPHGHRNVFFAKRSDARATPLFLKEGVSLYSFPLTSEGDEPADESPQLVANDTLLLYEEVRSHNGVVIPHTTGTGMGTDWRFHSADVEPVVEIFQGSRQSYESVGAPYAMTAEEAASDSSAPEPQGDKIEQLLLQMFRSRPEGMVTNAWAKGYRLGVIASSDHNSTHISYAMVYADDFSRQGILDAIKKRHTYAATDNILLEVRMGEHFMGDEFQASTILPLHIKARGTAKISRIDVIKDGRVIYTAKPDQQSVEIDYTDGKLDPTQHYYYVRLLQKDGMIAWSSPFFVNPARSAKTSSPQLYPNRSRP